MVLNVTNEQKAVIEQYGHTVIEFKAWCYKLCAVVIDTVEKTWRALMIFVEHITQQLKPFIDELVSKLRENIDYYKSTEVSTIYEKPKYAYVRSLGRKYEPKYCNLQYRRRCRDNC